MRTAKHSKSVRKLQCKLEDMATLPHRSIVETITHSLMNFSQSLSHKL